MRPPPSPPDEPVNPFAAPATVIGARAVDLTPDSEAEAIRRAHLNHEASVKAVGVLNYLGAAATLLMAGFCLAAAAGWIDPNEFDASVDPQDVRIGGTAIAVFSFAWTGLSFAVGRGLRRLRPWARWTEAAMTALQILFSLVGLNLIGLFISGYVLALMLSSKSNTVFSPPYQAVIAQTPHIRYRMSPVVWVLLIILLLVIGMAALGAIIYALQRPSPI